MYTFVVTKNKNQAKKVEKLKLNISHLFQRFTFNEFLSYREVERIT